jgi:catechol 2,3-dioxygenase-like lactoylglutathione lyase family enzyme
MVDKLAQIAVPADDLELARSFYGGVLGLPEIFSAPRVIAYDAAGIRLLLTHRPGHRPPGEPGAILYFDVRGIEAAHAGLLSKGAKDAGAPRKVAEHGANDIWVAFLEDPTGNMVGFIEERPAG